jgi:hypothetical protein
MLQEGHPSHTPLPRIGRLALDQRQEQLLDLHFESTDVAASAAVQIPVHRALLAALVDGKQRPQPIGTPRGITGVDRRTAR